MKETERQILFDITYRQSLKNTQMSEYNKKRSTLTDTENKLVATSGEKKWEGQDSSIELRGTDKYV